MDIKIKINNKILTGVFSVLAISTLVFAVPVFAQQGPTMMASSTRGRMLQRIANGQNRGGMMIDQRVTSLNNLLTRIQGLKNVSDTQKSTLTTTVQGVMSSMNTLKSQIAADMSTTSLRTDVSAITAANRVYALVIPQVSIIAAADRAETIVTMMNAISTKLQTRISSATTTPSSAVGTAMTDLSAKLSDANTQAMAAISEVSALTPDQGDKTKMAANTATLKDARTKIQAATKDIMAGRKDIATVTKTLGKM